MPPPLKTASGFLSDIIISIGCGASVSPTMSGRREETEAEAEAEADGFVRLGFESTTSAGVAVFLSFGCVVSSFMMLPHFLLKGQACFFAI